MPTLTASTTVDLKILLLQFCCALSGCPRCWHHRTILRNRSKNDAWTVLLFAAVHVVGTTWWSTTVDLKICLDYSAVRCPRYSWNWDKFPRELMAVSLERSIPFTTSINAFFPFQSTSGHHNSDDYEVSQVDLHGSHARQIEAVYNGRGGRLDAFVSSWFFTAQFQSVGAC